VSDTTISVKKPSVENNKSTGSQTVTVASKLPWDLELKLYDKRKESEQVHGMYREYFKYYHRVGSPTYLISGVSYNKNLGDNGKKIESGYSLTHNIPKAFWDEWLEQNKEGDFCKNGMIFAHTDLASVRSEGAEKASLRSGMERLDRDNLPTLNGRKINTADTTRM
jgi:hypothetical protein